MNVAYVVEPLDGLKKLNAYFQDVCLLKKVFIDIEYFADAQAQFTHDHEPIVFIKFEVSLIPIPNLSNVYQLAEAFEFVLIYFAQDFYFMLIVFITIMFSSCVDEFDHEGSTFLSVFDLIEPYAIVDLTIAS